MEINPTVIHDASALATHFEGFSARPYFCPARVPTIGYGSTRYEDGRRVKMSDPEISDVFARALLSLEIRNAAAASIRICPCLQEPLHIRRLVAITDFVYNLGAGRLQVSTLRRKINECAWPAAQAEILRWVYANGRRLPGLVFRRQAEAALFF